jgi:hypothetical protein
MTGIALLVALFPTMVFAGSPTTPNYGVVDPHKLWDPPPPWFYDVEKVISNPNAPGGQIRIVTDNLAPTPAGGVASGMILFPCQSTLGFKYNIVITGLVPLSKYTVTATEGSRFAFFLADPGDGSIEFEGPGSGIWGSPWLATAIDDLNLGTFKTDANGSGGVKGAIKLEAGYAYDVSVEVSDATGTTVLEPALEPNPNPLPTMVPDTTGFMVY